jgi:hypothetical protein
LRSKKPLWAKRRTSPLQERPERQEKRSGYSIAAERWGRAKWLIALRRLAKDYEYRVQTAETLISIAAIRLMLNRIAPA